jgi:hypothetical protein
MDFGVYYPERLHQAIILNAPSWFNVPWKMITGFLDANTRWALLCCCSTCALVRSTMTHVRYNIPVVRLTTGMLYRTHGVLTVLHRAARSLAEHCCSTPRVGVHSTAAFEVTGGARPWELCIAVRCRPQVLLHRLGVHTVLCTLRLVTSGSSHHPRWYEPPPNEHTVNKYCVERSR